MITYGTDGICPPQTTLKGTTRIVDLPLSIVNTADQIIIWDITNDITYKAPISDIQSVPGNIKAIDVSYDNTISSISALNVQTAIDEVVTMISGPTSDELVAISSNDTTPDFLLNKLNAGNNITLTTINALGNEQIQISTTLTSAPVDSVFGRTGVIIAQTNDYNSSQILENTNLYYTETRVSANIDVNANTSNRHSHINKPLLDTIIDTGTGSKYLADDGSYQTPSGSGDMTKNVYDPLNVEQDVYDLTYSHVPVGSIEGDVATLRTAGTNGDLEWAVEQIHTKDVAFTDQVGNPVITQLSDYFDVVESAGAYKLPSITDNLDGTIDIGSTEGIIAENPPSGLLYGVLNAFKFAGQSNLTLLEGINYLYFDWNNGNIVVETTNSLDNINSYSQISIDVIFKTGTTLDIAEVGFTNERGLNRLHRKDISISFVEHGSGMQISEVTTLGFALTDGIFWFGIIKVPINSYTTNITNFTYWYRDGIGGWNSTQSNSISNTLFDDNNGTLSTLSNNNHSVTYVYITPTGNVHVVYSQVNVRLYQDIKPPVNVPDIVRDFSILVGQLIVEKSATTFVEIKSPFINIFNAGIITIHSQLAGLNDDDHLQYLTDTRFDTRFLTKSTSDLSEGLNLYYTDTRFDTRLTTKTTDDISEGTNNLYHTDARFDTRFATKSTTDLSEGTNLYHTDARFDTRFLTKSTTDLSEGTNLYYTDARFDTRLATKTSDNLSEGTTNLYYTTTRADLKRNKSVSITSKTTTYTLIANDNDSILECSGTFTLTLPTLTTGFNFTMVNTGTGTITISGNINGGTTNTIVNSTQYSAISIYYNSTSNQIGIGNID